VNVDLTVHLTVDVERFAAFAPRESEDALAQGRARQEWRTVRLCCGPTQRNHVTICLACEMHAIHACGGH